MLCGTTTIEVEILDISWGQGLWSEAGFGIYLATMETLQPLFLVGEEFETEWDVFWENPGTLLLIIYILLDNSPCVLVKPTCLEGLGIAIMRYYLEITSHLQIQVLGP